ncbi:MAG: SDR family oxidoreductase [Anaerolineaceae bacterium]|nr:SDR family oxidoreductase [Anaerolineaceae bacterium]
MDTSANYEALYDFSGKTVVITGGGSGLGAGIARRFAQTGANLAIHYHHSVAKAEVLVEELTAQGVRAAAFQADLSHEDELLRFRDQVLATFGRVDVLVNNAGIYPVKPFLEMSKAEWDETIEIDLNAVFLCTQVFAKTMIDRAEGGAIVNIASIEARFPAFGHSHYNAAKAAVVMFTKSVASELGAHGIRVNAVSPGLMNRPGLAEAWPQGVNSWQSKAPLGRMGEGDDIGDACIFLASPAARWITGTELVVDGGISTTSAF